MIGTGTVGSNAAAVQFGDFPDDRQPEAKPHRARLLRTVLLTESIKHKRQKLLIDAFAGIRNNALDTLAAFRDFKRYRSSTRRELHSIVQKIDDHLADELLCDRQLRPITKRISRLKTLNGLRMEIRFAQSIIAAPDPWTVLRDFVYYPNYLRLADMEYRGAELKPGDRVVFLGSGPLPLSLICFCKQYGVQGIGIEQVPEYAKLSQKVIEVLALTEHIQIIRGNHLSLPLNEKYSLVMVAADANPKHEVFTHLAKTLPKGTRVSYRIYEKGLRRLMDDGAALDLPSVFREYLRIRPEPPVNNTSVFLIKTN